MKLIRLHPLPARCCAALLAASLAFGASSVVINEIHFNPDDKTTHEEFIELYNTGIAPVDGMLAAGVNVTLACDGGPSNNTYDMIRDMSDAGVGIVLVADTLEEAIGLSHTIIVVKDGAIQKRFDCAAGAKPTLYDLLHYMI